MATRTDYLGEIADEAKEFFNREKKKIKNLYIKETLDEDDYEKFRKGIAFFGQRIADRTFLVDTSEKAYDIIAESRNADDVPMYAPKSDGMMSYNDMLIKMARNVAAFTAEHVLNLEVMKEKTAWFREWEADQKSNEPGM